MPNVMRCDYCFFSLRNLKNWTRSRKAKQKLGRFFFFVLFGIRGSYFRKQKKVGNQKDGELETKGSSEGVIVGQSIYIYHSIWNSV